MFKSKVVFVVGAGASAEFKLPLGDELTLNIRRCLALRPGWPYYDVSDDRPYRFRIAMDLSATAHNVPVDFYFEAARELQRAMPLVKSIDAHLNSRRDSPAVVPMGKLGIAWAIAEAERSSVLANDAEHMHTQELRGSWHRSFLNLLTDELSEGEIQRMFANVQFIIFNYDRCVEHFLYTALRIVFPGIATNVLESVLTPDKFIHPYGVIGALPWQSTSLPNLPVLNFGELPTDQALFEASESLRIFTEGLLDTTQSQHIVDALEAANRCVFLGFSFHPQNMRLLQLNKGVGLTVIRNRDVVGTAYKASKSDIEEFRGRVRNSLRLPGGYPVNLEGITCSKLFEEYSQTIAA